MSTPLPPMRPTTDDEFLRYTQSKRVELIEDLTAGGMPKDTSSRIAFIAALDGMDRQANNNKKVAASLHGSETDRLVAAAVLELSKQLGPRNPYERVIEGDTIEPPLPDRSLLPTTLLVPGEDVVGIETEKYDNFVDRMEGEGITFTADTENP